jgi:hypothetical protein
MNPLEQGIDLLWARRAETILKLVVGHYFHICLPHSHEENDRRPIDDLSIHRSSLLCSNYHQMLDLRSVDHENELHERAASRASPCRVHAAREPMSMLSYPSDTVR